MSRAATARRVTILGLGLFGGGVGAARYFAERGARVVVSDARSEQALAESVEALKDLPIEYRLGGHRAEDFAGAELVVVNPAVGPDAPGMKLALESGARLDTEINLLFRLCPAPITAVTGSNGKSTTVALLGEMLRAAGRRTWVGGNLGGSLLPSVDQMAADDTVVLEISSFQAERLAWERRGPRVALVLNITPNHLDRHRDMEEYAAAKRRLIEYQRPEDVAILNADDPILRGWERAGAGRKFWISRADLPGDGVGIAAGAARLRDGARSETISLAPLRPRGAHNRFDAACAALAAWLMSADPAAIARGMAEFSGLPDRIEFVAEKNGARYYNDSIATTPESTLVALAAFDEPIILIAGGSPKNLSYAKVGRAIARRARDVILLGRTAPEIESAVRAAGAPQPNLLRVAGMAEAVAAAHRLARPGDVILMSPASASFDMFANYAERGRKFKEFVRAL